MEVHRHSDTFLSEPVLQGAQEGYLEHQLVVIM